MNDLETIIEAKEEPKEVVSESRPVKRMGDKDIPFCQNLRKSGVAFKTIAQLTGFSQAAIEKACPPTIKRK